MATRPLPEAVEFRFAPYIEELHEFFATSRVPFGAPEDIVGVMDRLRAPGTFHDDMSSLVRSFVLRQGGAMPHAQLMEILALAIAGPEMARSPQQYREPLRELLTFVSGVMRRPFNVLPGDRFEAEVVPFPSDGKARGEQVEPSPEVGVEAAARPEPEIVAVPEADVRAIEAEPEILQAAPIPIDVREPVAEAATPPLVPDDPLPPQTPSDPIPAPEPSPAPSLGKDAALSGKAETIAPASAKVEESAPMSAISAALAAESERAGHASPEKLQPIATVEPDLQRPMLKPIPNAVREPEIEDEPRRSGVPREIVIAAVGALVLAAVLIFTFRERKPREVYTVGPVSSTHPSNSTASRGSAASSGVSSPGSKIQMPAPGVAYPPKPSANGPALTGKALRRAQQLAAAAAAEDVAQPYSSAPQYAPRPTAAPVLTQPATGVSRPVPQASVPQPQSSAPASTYAPYNGGANPAPTAVVTTQPEPAPIVREPVRRRDPDAAIVGDAPAGSFASSTAGRSSYFTVSSGVMAANLISSPEPDYPTLARLAHVQGQVILQAVISKDGTVSNTRVLRGSRFLRGAAQDAVRRWRYKPYRVNGRAVDVATIITVDFHNGR